jgi:hypothetical protein
MNVKVKRNARISKFTYAIKRVTPTRHANLVNVFPEGTNVGDDVDVPTLGLLRHRQYAIRAWHLSRAWLQTTQPNPRSIKAANAGRVRVFDHRESFAASQLPVAKPTRPRAF